MNEIVNKFLSAGDKFILEIPEMHLRQLRYQKELDKACFQHEISYRILNI